MALAAVTCLENAWGTAPPEGSPTIAADALGNGWRVLRIVECARCHGKDYQGLAAPSIVEYARTQSRERFIGMVLDGDPPRGMPGYRGNALVVESIDDIYGYFRARATGEIDANYRPQPR